MGVGRRRRSAAGPVVAAIDPDRVDPQPLRRRVIVIEALGDVEDPGRRDPARVEPLAQGFEVVDVRLVAADLLGGDDPVEVDAEAAVRGREEGVVAIRQDAQLESSPQLLEGPGRVVEGRPVADRAAERGRLVVGQLRAEPARDLAKSPVWR